MAKLIASFVTRPRQGSEGGVGWAFASEAARWAVSRREKLFIVIDARDYEDIGPSIGETPEERKWVEVVPVPVPKFLLRRYGNSRTRLTYIGWRLRARTKIRELVSSGDIDVVHQVTFATMSLPHVMPALKGVRRVWGPVAIPSAPVASLGKEPPLVERVSVRVLQLLARHQARNVDLVISNNRFTQEWLSPSPSILEPNIFLDVKSMPEIAVDDYLLSYCGLLIDRKRPWIAINAMKDPRLARYKLQIIGDGELRPELESLVRREGLESRISFLGRVERDVALREVASSRVLLHPAAREGSAWVIGEAAALGVPAVAFEGSGADSTIALSQNGGQVSTWRDDQDIEPYVDGLLEVLSRPRPEPTERWNLDRIPLLLDGWWSTRPQGTDR